MNDVTRELVSGFDNYTEVSELAAALETSAEAKTPGFSITTTITVGIQ